MDVISIFMKLLKIPPHPEGHFCEVMCYEGHNTGELAHLSITGSKPEICMCFWDALSCGEGSVVSFFLVDKHKGRINLWSCCRVYSVLDNAAPS